jgi:hypothetical protein
MRPEEFLELLRRRPFVPLRIHLTDGKTFELRHPDNIIVFRSYLDIGVPADPNTGVSDRVEHVSLVHVVRIEQLASPAPVGGNGG